ncbi:transcriptional regulator LuxR family [Bacteroides sp. CAG:462]|nr:transcriptional regulator LuxR family [Bacteroides sp. CAG:462]
MTAYAVCCLLTQDEHITGIFAGVVGVFVLVWLMGTRLIELLTELSKTNDEMKVTQREIFSLFRMDKAALLSVAHLAGKQDLSPQQTGKLLERIADPEDEEQVDRDLAGWYEQHRTDASLLEQVFPMLSPSQREICKLIVEGYKLREICEVLGKTESNVTCQRSNIRARLQLDKADNLREVLQARLDAYVRSHSPKS